MEVIVSDGSTGGLEGAKAPRNLLAPSLAPTFLERYEILKFLHSIYCKYSQRSSVEQEFAS